MVRGENIIDMSIFHTLELAQIEVNLIISMYNKSNEQNLDKLKKGQSCKGLL